MDENKIIHLNGNGRTEAAGRDDMNTSNDGMIEAAKRGDVDAFCGIYDQYKDRLYRYAFYRLGNAQDAEDAVSECVLSSYRQIRQLRDAKAFPAWIFKILSAECAKLISQQAARSSADATGLTMQDPAETVTLRLDLQHALAQLTAEEKEIVLLSLVAGFTSQEIAQMTGSRPGTVRSKQSRSLAKMRAYLEGRS